MFILHPKLEFDTFHIGDLPLCSVLLMNDSRFPWLVLVPRRDGLRELFDLDGPDYRTTMEEIRFVAARFSALCGAHKMNIAALGNMVPQLHIHIIARQPNDAAWPQPVWSTTGVATPYEPQALAVLADRIATCLEA